MFRTRTLMDVDEFDVNTRKLVQNGNTVSIIPVSFQSREASHTISDIVTPNWRKLLDSGVIINNPLSDYLHSLEHTGGYELQQTDANNYYELTNIPKVLYMRNSSSWTVSGPAVPSRDVSNEIAYAKLAAISKIESTPFDFSEDVLELRKTLHTLINPLTLARNLSNEFADRYRFYSSAKHRSVAQSLSKAWLEVRFGWRPIFISLENILVASNVARAKRPTVERHVVTSDVIRKDLTADDSYTYTAGFYTINTERVHRGYTDVKAGILYEVTEPLRNWQWNYGVRPRDLIRAVYNVVPYSWVVDKFLSIDKSIKGLTSLADSSVKIRAGWVKQVTDYTDVETVVSGSHQNITFIPPTGASTSETIQWKSRTVWHPEVTDSFPVFRISKLDTLPQVADLVALVANNLKPQYKGGHVLI